MLMLMMHDVCTGRSMCIALVLGTKDLCVWHPMYTPG